MACLVGGTGRFRLHKKVGISLPRKNWLLQLHFWGGGGQKIGDGDDEILGIADNFFARKSRGCPLTTLNLRFIDWHTFQPKIIAM